MQRPERSKPPLHRRRVDLEQMVQSDDPHDCATKIPDAHLQSSSTVPSTSGHCGRIATRLPRYSSEEAFSPAGSIDLLEPPRSRRASAPPVRSGVALLRASRIKKLSLLFHFRTLVTRPSTSYLSSRGNPYPAAVAPHAGTEVNEVRSKLSARSTHGSYASTVTAWVVSRRRSIIVPFFLVPPICISLC